MTQIEQMSTDLYFLICANLSDLRHQCAIMKLLQHFLCV